MLVKAQQRLAYTIVTKQHTRIPGILAADTIYRLQNS